MNVPAVCAWCWGDHAAEACPYSAGEAAAIRKARKRRSEAREGRDSRTPPEAPSELRPGAGLPGRFRDGRGRFETARQRARGGRPRNPVRSRSGRFRDRHPEYRQRERARLRRKAGEGGDA